MTATCAVEGCGRPGYGRGWCVPHYRRWRRHGDVRAAVAVAARTSDGGSYSAARRRLAAQRGPAPGQACAECGGASVCWSYDGSDPHERTDPGRGVRYSLDLGRYRPRCRFCHRRAVVAAGADLPGVPRGRRPTLRRLGAERGRAAELCCAECGGSAVCWSYDGSDPDERTDPSGGVRYSLDLGRYRARCRFCHRRAVVAASGDLPGVPRGRRPSLDVDTAARLYLAGATCRGIGSLMGVSLDAVRQALHAHGVELRASGRPRRRPTPAQPTPDTNQQKLDH